jgi:A-kinase anchor protein 9
MQQKQSLEMQLELSSLRDRAAELQEQLSSEKMVVAELKSELAQAKLELGTTLKAQHKRLKELEAFRYAECFSLRGSGGIVLVCHTIMQKAHGI